MADTLILNGEHQGLEFKNTKYLITKDSILEPLGPNFSKYYVTRAYNSRQPSFKLKAGVHVV